MRHPIVVAAGLLAASCNGSTSPSRVNRVTVYAARPLSGILVVPPTYPYIVPGGVLLPKGSGLISVAVAFETAPVTPRARLNVYLTTGPGSSDYCGQNSPDSPLWDAPPPSATFEVTGFRVYRLPCEVTGIRVMLHSRPDDGLLTPPRPEETLAEATFPVHYTIRQD
jgi:hypothetical protein